MRCRPGQPTRYLVDGPLVYCGRCVKCARKDHRTSCASLNLLWDRSMIGRCRPGARGSWMCLRRSRHLLITNCAACLLRRSRTLRLLVCQCCIQTVVLGVGRRCADGARRGTCLWHLCGDLTSRRLDDLVPRLRVGRGVRFELKLVRRAHVDTEFALAHVIALDCKLGTINCTNDAIWKIQRVLWLRILCQIIIRVVLVQILGWCHNVVVRLVRACKTGLALERASDKWLCGWMILIWELNGGQCTRWRCGVDRTPRSCSG